MILIYKNNSNNNNNNNDNNNNKTETKIIKILIKNKDINKIKKQ